ncbi:MULTISPECIES: hypothetical protein [unclassified Polaribacter]|uniref:hypothetical protein n=1 Tax=unclassified Polaribacter TaxID=196858 RepID=UPI0011BEC7D9|nr:MULTISPECIES: hypothetical protein [unclassified Polaribacter]TXD48473.1 hypothetical protein ES043_17855 [Polaribacter sp. IC063]TXD55726.1 hypothetical protein ES044_17760 [Polaribacter sp. IC066]
MDTKKIIFIALLLLFISACGHSGFEEEEGSAGFIIHIYNTTDKEYSGFVLYIGDELNGRFIEKDSLVGKNVKIYKKDEGPYSSITNGEQRTYIRSNREFRDLEGLSEFGKWIGKFGTLERLYFKVKLSDGTTIFSENPKLRINSSSEISLILRDGGNKLLY